jgi:hypothetical protein
MSILMAQDGKIGLFSIESNERSLDVSISPLTFRPLEMFDNTAEAFHWIDSYNNR